MNRKVAKMLAPHMRRLLDAAKALDIDEDTYLTREEMRDAEESVEMLEELANSEPEPWEREDG